jgi:hypothetical protein
VAEGVGQPVRDGSKEFVAGGGAESLVHDTKPVEVDTEYGERRQIATGSTERRLQ